MIIQRYLNREILTTMLVVTGMLIFIFMCNQFVRYLNDAAIGRMTAYSVLQMMSIQVPLLAGFMMPLGFYIGLLLSYGRLYADSEMLILFGSGISRLQLLGITFLGASITMMIVGVLMIWVEPKMAWYRNHILSEAVYASPLEKMAPGRFQVINNKLIFYAEELSRDRKDLENVFLAEIPNSDGESYNVLSSKSAHQVKHPISGESFVEFNQGSRYVGQPGQQDYQIVEFSKYGVKIPQQEGEIKRLEESASTKNLWKERHSNKLAAAELQWRFSMPLSVLILTLIAIPLSKVKPRQGRYAKLVPAILFYIVYIDLLFVGQSWVQRGIVNTTIGMWWVHGLMLLVGIVLYARKR